ncbi:hypothetical protein NQ314_004647 [Rhamnusium bicolor]|uniref:Uncharacterized protein n=1 Tax=Rhamnusium bicolor TaxID=1586634 RepID=A0AAV8ZKT3_9CUCU|nr:hypothetical protein NQ314_004647 [Rhamnusium bicolor]
MVRKLGNHDKMKIDNCRLKLFTKDLQPFSIVEDEGFRELFNLIIPSYQLPSRKTVSNTFIPAKYEETFNKTKEVLNNIHTT